MTVRTVLLALGGLTILGLCVLLTFPLPRNSDDANCLLAALDLLHGNVRLAGWLLTPDDYLTTDMSALALLSVPFGRAPALLSVDEGLMWGGAVLLGIGLAARGLPRPAAITAGLTVVTLLALTIHRDGPEVDALGILASHASSVLLGLALFWLGCIVVERRRVGALVAVLVVSMLGSFADPVFTLFACLPLAATCLLRLGTDTRTLGALAAATLLGAACGEALLQLNAATGGFRLLGLELRFAGFGTMLRNVPFALHCLMRFMGADFSGQPVTLSLRSGVLIFVMRAPLVPLLAVALLQTARTSLARLRDWPDTRPEAGFLDQLLCTAFVLYLAAVICSSLFRNWTDARYVIPAFAVGAILLGRQFSSVRPYRIYLALVLAASLASEASAVAAGPWRPLLVPEAQRQLARALRRAGLEHGYAGYWDGSMLTALTRGRVTSLAVAEMPDGHVHPFRWFGDMDWYRRAAADWHGRVFFIASLVPEKPMDLAQDRVLAEMGRPEQIIAVGRQLIDVYRVAPGGLDRLLPEGG